MPQFLDISPQSEFFIALCQRQVHSYVTVGMKTGEKIEVLASHGKGATGDASSCSFVFWDTSAYIGNETFMFRADHERQVSYKAYAITYQHYLEFLDYLKRIAIHQHTELEAYCPDSTQPLRLEWKSIVEPQTENQEDNSIDLNRYGRLGLFNNTCRHSAIELTRAASHRYDLGRGISSLFFNRPPLSTVFFDGKVNKPDSPFYILPLPPQSFAGLSPKKLSILVQLYQRLDEIVLCAQQHPMTFQKFNKIKTLYNDLTANCTASIMDIMQGIEAWESENKSLIAQHRKPHWFAFQTATEKMFARFHEQFALFRREVPKDNAFQP